MTKSIFASKTAWINVAMAIVIILGDPAVTGIIPEGWTPGIAAIVAIINILVRLSTSQPAEFKSPRRTT